VAHEKSKTGLIFPAALVASLSLNPTSNIFHHRPAQPQPNPNPNAKPNHPMQPK
jgi:hypothetical protein